MIPDNLDVNTERGQVSLAHERRAVQLFEARYPDWRYIHTDKRTMAKADGLLLRGDRLGGMVLTSCRYDCTRATFLRWNSEWLVTWRKIALAAVLCKHLQTRLYGFLYIVDEDVLLTKLLYDPRRLPGQRWRAEMRLAYTETRATINGGIALRKNAFIKLDGATEVVAAAP